MTSAHEQVVQALMQREPACGRTRVVAIDGRSGAGKTVFAQHVAQRLNASVFSLEDIFPGWSGLEAAIPAAREVLSAIAVDEVGQVARWDWEADRPGEIMAVHPTPVLVIEGVGAGATALRPFLSLLVWLEAPEPVRKARALARDGETYAPWWQTWAEQERVHFARELTAGSADIVVHTG